MRLINITRAQALQDLEIARKYNNASMIAQIEALLKDGCVNTESARIELYEFTSFHYND